MQATNTHIPYTTADIEFDDLVVTCASSHFALRKRVLSLLPVMARGGSWWLMVTHAEPGCVYVCVYVGSL